MNHNFKININGLFKYYNLTFSFFKYNEYINCQTCKKMNKHLQNKKFYFLPKNLIIYLDKTKCKNNINIDFDEKLIINDEINKNNPYEYNLIGVISEIKDKKSGKIKYVSFIKKENKWIYCDIQSNNGRNFVSFTNIKNCGNIISLFYYDEKRVPPTNSFANNKNKCNNNVNNVNNNINQYYSKEYLNQYISNNLYNNTIPYNRNNNNNAFHWQAMPYQQMIINNNNLGNNNPNNQFNNNVGNNIVNNNQGFNNNMMFNNYLNNNI